MGLFLIHFLYLIKSVLGFILKLVEITASQASHVIPDSNNGHEKCPNFHFLPDQV